MVRRAVQYRTQWQKKKERSSNFFENDNEKGLSFFTDLFTGIHNRTGLFMAFQTKN